MKNVKIMVVDDDKVILKSMKDYLGDYTIETFYDPKEAVAFLQKHPFDIIVSDYKMPGLTGLELFIEGRCLHAYKYGILLTAYADKELLKQFINRDLISAVLEKPLNLETLKRTIDNGIRFVVANRTREDKLKTMKQEYEAALKVTGYLNERIIGTETGLKEVCRQVGIVSKTDESVLITGETGTGKEVAARTIHALSKRKKGPFIKINCGSIPDSLMESEIFGYIHGAFSGAGSDKPGKIELADKGTLFLDEIAELKTETQTKLLHVIQEKVLERLGSNKSIKVDFRLISATNRDLDKMLKEGSFRNDLYYRINTLQIEMPPLRGRIEDMDEFIQYFLTKDMKEVNRLNITIDKQAIQKLKTYEWPGNIRELENVIKRAVILLDKDEYTITADAFDYLFYSSVDSIGASTALESISKEIIDKKISLKTVETRILENIVAHFNGNIMKAVQGTGISKDRFYRNRKRNID